MKYVALMSGGKDSIYSILECERNGHELVACVHLGAPEEEEEESYMYQTAASEVMPTLVEDCLGVPLILYRRVGKSVNTSLVYQHDPAGGSECDEGGDNGGKCNEGGDEVEDLYQALNIAIQRFPNVQAVSSGAILSTYQRVRIEDVCSRLNLTSISYLWRMAPQKELLLKMIDDGLQAVLVKTACPPGLIPHTHLNKTIGALYHSGLFQRLHDTYQFHMCGEGGEYETLVLDCPNLFKKKLVLDEVQIVETEDGVGVLVIKKCHAEPKHDAPHEHESIWNTDNNNNNSNSNEVSNIHPPPFRASNHSVHLPHVRRGSGGLIHLSQIMSPIAAFPLNNNDDNNNNHDNNNQNKASEADLAVKEALAIFQLLEQTLLRNNATTQDVIFVHLYLSEMSHFASINKHYRSFFGTVLPPSRSCVAVGKHVLPGGRRVLMDCMVQCGSGNYIRSSSSTVVHQSKNPDNTQHAYSYADAARLSITSKLRHVLHVQSISYWAPVCVGPYSQANTLRSGLHFLAGQIGLIPSTMQLHPTWIRQLEQCWTNIANVLDSLDSGSLDNVLSSVVYVSDHIYCATEENARNLIESTSRQQLLANGGVIPDAIDLTSATSTLATAPYGGYEDEETWREMTQQDTTDGISGNVTQPLLLVSIPEMPAGALVEVEVICVSQKAASCLAMQTKSIGFDRENIAEEGEMTLSWDTGYDFPSPSLTEDEKEEELQINIATRSIGNGCAGVILVTAGRTLSPDDEQKNALPTFTDINQVLDAMVDAFVKSIHAESSSSGLSIDHVLHIRLFYVASAFSPTVIHGEKNSSSNGEKSNIISFHANPQDDASRLACALNSTIAAQWCKNARTKDFPACTIVPVQAMAMVQIEGAKDKGAKNQDRECCLFAMQVLVADPVHLETEMWIHHGRKDDSTIS